MTKEDEVVSDFSPSITILEVAIETCKIDRDNALRSNHLQDVATCDNQIQSHEVAIEILKSMMDEE